MCMHPNIVTVVSYGQRTTTNVTDNFKMRASLTPKEGLMIDTSQNRGRNQNDVATSQPLNKLILNFHHPAMCWGYVSAPKLSVYGKPKVQIHNSTASQQPGFVLFTLSDLLLSIIYLLWPRDKWDPSKILLLIYHFYCSQDSWGTLRKVTTDETF